MSVEITWFGHNAWEIKTGDQHILIDPFLNDSPVSPIQAKDVKATHILVSHGHMDHVGDAAAIANRTGATIVAIYEIADWFAKNHNVKNTIGMNLGGGVDLPFGRVKMTLAFHSSVLPDGTYGGNPAGFLVSLVAGPKIYFACDTALFGDMKLIGDEGLTLAVLPIGDLFTMGPEDSLKAISLLRPQRVAPAHFNTWPPIAQDADRWAQRVRQETKADPVLVKPGESFSI